MRRFANRLISVPLALLAGACSEVPAPTVPLADAPSLNLSALPSSEIAPRQVLMLDACDPASFNAAFGPGFCSPANGTRQGGIPLSTFLDLLQKNGRVDAWRFAPDVIHVTSPVTMTIPNVGGIPHSFTEVEEFGGGFVPFLNLLSGNPIPAPECVHPSAPTAPNPGVSLIPPGGHDTHTFLPGENKKFMCCIHPWMRAMSM